MTWQAAKKAVEVGGSEDAKPSDKKASIEALKDLTPQERQAFIVVVCHEGDRSVLRGEKGEILTEEQIDALVDSAKAKLGKKKASE